MDEVQQLDGIEWPEDLWRDVEHPFLESFQKLPDILQRQDRAWEKASPQHSINARLSESSWSRHSLKVARIFFKIILGNLDPMKQYLILLE